MESVDDVHPEETNKLARRPIMFGASVLIGLKAKMHKDLERKTGEELMLFMERQERERQLLLTLEIINLDEWRRTHTGRK